MHPKLYGELGFSFTICWSMSAAARSNGARSAFILANSAGVASSMSPRNDWTPGVRYGPYVVRSLVLVSPTVFKRQWPASRKWTSPFSVLMSGSNAAVNLVTMAASVCSLPYACTIASHRNSVTHALPSSCPTHTHKIGG